MKRAKTSAAKIKRKAQLARKRKLMQALKLSQDLQGVAGALRRGKKTKKGGKFPIGKILKKALHFIPLIGELF